LISDNYNSRSGIIIVADHPSIPHNPLISNALFLAHFIERAGSGTLDIIAFCRKAGLPAPKFEQRSGQFVLTIWLNQLTEKKLARLNLNPTSTLILHNPLQLNELTF